MKTLSAFFFFALVFTFNLSAHAGSCPDFAKVIIEGATELENTQACQSLHKIDGFFKALGVNVDPEMKLIFEDVVYLPQEAGAPAEDKTQVYGYYDTDTREIRLMHFSSFHQKDRVAWNISWSDELASSFLLHEMSHLIITSYMGKDFKKISRAWHEALAYAVQLNLMSPGLRSQILAQYPDIRQEPFSDAVSINAMSYGVDPDKFALRAFLSIHQWGQGAFIKNVLDGKVPGTSEE